MCRNIVEKIINELQLLKFHIHCVSNSEGTRFKMHFFPLHYLIPNKNRTEQDVCNQLLYKCTIILCTCGSVQSIWHMDEVEKFEVEIE